MEAGRKVKKSPKRKAYAAPALEKGLDVLELLALELGGLTKSEISRQLDRSASEIFRMLLCLEERGYIAQTEGERYSLTLKLFRMVQEHPPTEQLIAKSIPVMQRLTQEVQQSCHMGIIEGAQVVILAQVSAPTIINFSVKLGSAIDLMEATTGYVILAHQSAARREYVLSQWKRITGKKLPADLSTHLAAIRRKGFDKHSSYKVRGVLNICYPIFDVRASAIGALSVPYVQHTEASKTTKATGDLLRVAADEITAAIGGNAARPAEGKLLSRAAE